MYGTSGEIIEGNYDPDSKIVSEEFKNNQVVIENVNTAIKALSESISLFSGRKFTDNQIFELRNYLHPSAYSPETVEYFRNLLQKVSSCIMNILKGGGNSQQDVQQPFHSDRSSVKYTSSVNSGLIKATSKTKIVTSSFTPTTVLSDYSLLEASLSDTLNIPSSQTQLSAPSTARRDSMFPTIQNFTDHLSRQSDKNTIESGGVKPEFFYTVDPNSFKVLSESSSGVTTSPSDPQPPSTDFVGFGPTDIIIDTNIVLPQIQQPMIPMGPNTTGATLQGLTQLADNRANVSDIIQAISTGGINMILGKQEYDSYSASKKSVADMEISFYKNSDPTNEGTTNKGGIYAPYQLFAQLGMGFNIGSGVVSNNFVTDAILDFFGPNISESLVKSLCDSIKESDEKEEYASSVLEGVRQLATLRNDFSDVFQMMANMASYNNSLVTNIPQASSEELYIEDNREFFIRDPKPSNPFDEEVASPFIHSTVSEGIKINLNNFNVDNRISTESEKKFVLVRLARDTSEANVMPVNDSILLEV